MIRNSIICSIRVCAVATAIVLAIGTLGCGGDDDDDGPNKAGNGGGDSGSGGDDSGSGGTSGGNYEPATERCPYENPPLKDPFCLNMACPLASLSTIEDANKPMGDCCNTVDVQRREESLPEGETYDLELVAYVNLPASQESVANVLIQGLMLSTQESGGDIILVRLHDVPRTADMTEPVTVTLEIGSGKLNCDGTFSFYGPNAAGKPLDNTEGKVPNDPGRWASHLLEVTYNGFEAEDLIEKPSEEATANSTKVTYVPRWDENGLTYEQPLQFLMIILQHNEGNWSCFGSIDRDGEWDETAKLMPFVPIEEAKYTKIEDLGFQSQCGLFSLEAYNGECDDLPQEEWTHYPTGYCDQDYKCWIGDPTFNEYTDFWTELYPGENGCGEGHDCCDPTGTDASMETCNAYYLREACVFAAAEITDDPIDDPSQAASFRTICEGGE